jgi:hypothetical protein
MKQVTLFIALGILFMQTAYSQDSLASAKSPDTVLRPHIYQAYVFQPGHRSAIKGFLISIQDSSLCISQTKLPYSFDQINVSSFEKYNYGHIQKVIVSKPGVSQRATLIGLLAGAAIGALIGYASGSDQGWFALDAGGKAVVGALIGAGAGSIAGALIGKASQKNFLINGEWKSLEEMKTSLQNIK